MKNSKLKIFGIAVIINIALFASLAVISYQKDENKIRDVVESKIQAFFPLEEVVMIEEEKIEKDCIISDLRPEINVTQSKILDLNMDLPELNFSINPQIRTTSVINFKAPTLNSLYELSDLDRAPLPKFRRSPVYPYRARRLNIEGEVVLKFVVTSKGDVSDIKVVKSTPKGVFEKSAIRCVSAWKFSPGELSGSSVNSIFVVPLKYRLKS
ncbi:MAG: energy transducer TonB [Desulfobacterales bacterium]|nr:energy transducer TonB [Desulfobacterales bacterium]